MRIQCVQELMSEFEIGFEEKYGDCFEAEIDEHAERLKLLVVFVCKGF